MDKLMSSRDKVTIDNWNIDRINSDLNSGFELLKDIKPSVSFFGSARVDSNNEYYISASNLANMFADRGYNIITGGSNGIMEAGNRGAFQNCNIESIGLNINLPKEQKINSFTTRQKTFDYLFVRKIMLIRYSFGYIIYPGGYGTLDELFEVLTLIQTRKILHMPIFLIGVDFWEPLYRFITTKLLTNNLITIGDEKLLTITDNLEYVVEQTDINLTKTFRILEDNGLQNSELYKKIREFIECR